MTTATNAIRATNDGLAFMLELTVLAALAWWGIATGDNLVVKIVLGIAGPAVVVLVWARWLAPRSDHRINHPWLLIVKVAVFAAAALAPTAIGHPLVGAGIGAAAALNLGAHEHLHRT